MSGIRVRTASVDDTHAVVDSLASAFQEDPSFVWCIPGTEERRRLLREYFGVVFDALRTHGGCYCVPDAAAAALWVPPGRQALTEEQGARLRQVFEAVGAAEADRFADLIGVMDACHPHPEHFYLWFLGVASTAQRRGLGSALLRSRLGWCDLHSVPAYLEATSDGNRRLYERHGFHVTGEFTAGGSPPMWSMWRDAGAPWTGQEVDVGAAVVSRGARSLRGSGRLRSA